MIVNLPDHVVQNDLSLSLTGLTVFVCFNNFIQSIRPGDERPDLARIQQTRDAAQRAAIQLGKYPVIVSTERFLNLDSLRKHVITKLHASSKTVLIDQTQAR